MKRYRSRSQKVWEAVEWIAWEDNPGDAEGVAAIAGYLTVVLVSELFGWSREEIAQCVFDYREEKGWAGKTPEEITASFNGGD